MTPYFSVLIPLYNKAQEITATLSSVLDQVFTDFEIIIINDGSTDDSLKQVKIIHDERIRVFTTKNKGVSHARNFGIQQSKATRIAFLDADDLWKPHHLKDLKSLFETYPNCGMYCKAYEKIIGRTVIASQYKDITKAKYWHGVVEDYFHHSQINSLSTSSSIAMEKSIFNTVGYFNEHYTSGEDTDLWIRTALQYPTAFDNNVSVTINLNASRKLTNSPFTSRSHLDLDTFKKEELKNISLKKYLDLNRYAIAIQYKLENEHTHSKTIFKKIDLNNLSTLQKLVYQSPNNLTKNMLKLRNLLRKGGINLRLFRS